MQQPDEFVDKLQQNLEILSELFGNSSDVVFRQLLPVDQTQVTIVYIEGLIDSQILQQDVIRPILEMTSDGEMTPTQLKDKVVNVGGISFVSNHEDASNGMLSGGALILIDGYKDGLLVSIPGLEERAITESDTHPIIRGPKDAFTEVIRTNISLVRHRVKDTRVRVQTIQAGNKTKTELALMYMDGLADQQIVSKLKDKLSNLQVDRVLEGEYIEEVMNQDNKLTIFPMLYNTDRPDTIAAGVMEGRIAIFIDGTPFVLLAPSLFVDFLQSAEDNYQSYLYGSVTRLLRYFCMLICLLAPALYIALTTYHQDLIPTVLLLSLMAQREGVPFPAFLEALIMEVVFEILREAGLRMPRTIGQAVSIVGSIVIGQAAVEAGIVSTVMVVVVAITAIASFAIPSYSMSIPIRMLRFGFMMIASTLGIYGLTIAFIMLVVHLSGLHSFGVPYLSPVAPYKPRKQSDAILRFPYQPGAKGP
ncbi:spore germination protein KA [Paenibacillus barengoltzii]|jgi:spore germination protein KA|uniref:spore germination protein n=1 Tax=Paenibacillus barengoltzii TaxID=343517 RepID=UPI000A08DF51|nr:spore germination protein [Paenibacillus barengoltzii]SMF55949.1 spore germination protein KA [Paenibacillus barengoltzii]